jgi:hypothetical protein
VVVLVAPVLPVSVPSPPPESPHAWLPSVIVPTVSHAHARRFVLARAVITRNGSPSRVPPATREPARAPRRTPCRRELRELMSWAGLSDVRLYGGLDGRPYGPGARRLVAVGRK